MMVAAAGSLSQFSSGIEAASRSSRMAASGLHCGYFVQKPDAFERYPKQR